MSDIPQPESRLLTMTEGNAQALGFGKWHAITYALGYRGGCKAQRDLTASFYAGYLSPEQVAEKEKQVEIEWIKALMRGGVMVANSEQATRVLKQSQAEKDAEVAEKVKEERERIFREIEDIISWGGYEELQDGTKVRDGHIMSEPWQALKG